MSGNGKALLRPSFLKSSVFEDLIRPWNEWFDERMPVVTQSPAVNIKETAEHYEIKLAAPGMEKDDFKIDVNGSLITISAERDEEKEVKGETYTRKEYSFSSFTRSFSLPEDIDRSKIDANYVQGELRLLLPKREEAKKTPHLKINVH